jgi:hypothetical protein
MIYVLAAFVNGNPVTGTLYNIGKSRLMLDI